MMTQMTEVVAAMIWDKDKFMICQHPPHKTCGLLWEFVDDRMVLSETKQRHSSGSVRRS